MARESLSSRAIVLRSVPYRDADLILTLYTESRGRLSAQARSARKSRRRFGSSLGLFMVAQVELSNRGGQLWTINGAQLQTSFAQLALDMPSFAHASYGTELVRELTAEEQPDERVFSLILELYRELDAGGAAPIVLRAFEINMLRISGLAPMLTNCVGCGNGDVEARGAVLDPGRGGVCCPVCAALSRGVGVRPISPGALRLLRAVQEVASLAAARALPVSEPDDAAEARDILLSLLLSHIGKPLRSLEFIAKVSGALRENRQNS